MNRRPVTVSTVVLSAALLSACGTGLHAQTYREVGRADGASTNLSGLQVRNLHVAPPATAGSTITGTATLLGTLVNNGDTADALVSGSTDAAASVTLNDSGQPATQVPVPAHGISPSTWSATLNGLTAPLRPGSYITVTLVFDKAGRTVLQVPVRAGDNGVSERSSEQVAYHTGE